MWRILFNTKKQLGEQNEYKVAACWQDQTLQSGKKTAEKSCEISDLLIKFNADEYEVMHMGGRSSLCLTWKWQASGCSLLLKYKIYMLYV